MKAKKPGTPVNDTIKRSIRRNMQRGIWGSKGPRRSTGQGPSCVGPSASMTGLDMTIVNPLGYSTMANGAWAWYRNPNNWFERWVPKPNKGENPVEWAVRVGVVAAMPVILGVADETAMAAINAQFAHLDWATPDRTVQCLTDAVTHNPH